MIFRALTISLSLLLMVNCTSNSTENESSNTAETKSDRADTTNAIDESDVRFYHEFLKLGLDLPETWERASVETETNIRKMYYGLDHSKMAVDIVGVYQNVKAKDFLALSTSSTDNNWVFDEVKANEYFMNKVKNRFTGDYKGMRYVGFDLEFKGGLWTRVYMFNAPLRNFEIDFVSYGSELENTEQKVVELIHSIKI